MSDRVITSTSDTPEQVAFALGRLSFTPPETPKPEIVTPPTATETAAPVEPVAEAAPETPVEPPKPAEEPKPAEAATDEEAENPDTKPERLTPTQKRINRAVRLQREAERRELAAREDAARMKGRMEALEAAQAMKPPAPVAAPVVAPPDPADPEPKIDDPGIVDYDDWVRKQARWVARQEFKTARAQWEATEAERKAADARATAERERQTQEATHRTAVQAFIVDHPDYDVKLSAATFPIAPGSPAATDFADLLQSARDEKGQPIGPQVLYYLATHPEEGAAFGAAQNQRELARAFGRVEARIASAATPASASVTPAAVSAAPAPVTPVASAPKPESAPVTDYQAYKARRLQELAAQRGAARR